MKVDTFLKGGLTRRRLPCLQPPTGPDAPLLRRVLLPQGELAQIHDGVEGMRYMAVMELIEGTVRGNHVHARKVEHVYLVQGQVELWVRQDESGPRESMLISPGDLVIIQPGVEHALRVVQKGWGIEFSPQEYDPQDTRRVALLPPNAP